MGNGPRKNFRRYTQTFFKHQKMYHYEQNEEFQGEM